MFVINVCEFLVLEHFQHESAQFHV